MKHLILIDSILIGSFLFKAYIFEKNSEEAGFGIFIENMKSPLLWMIRDAKSNKIKIHIDEDLVTYIGTKSVATFDQREQNFKTVLEFITESEHKAAYMVFKDQEMEYFMDSKQMVKMKNKYIKLALSPQA